MNKIINFLLGNGNKGQAKDLHDSIIKSKDEDIKDLQKINKSFRLLLEEGHVEIVIKNVKGVIQEDYKKK